MLVTSSVVHCIYGGAFQNNIPCGINNNITSQKTKLHIYSLSNIVDLIEPTIRY